MSKNPRVYEPEPFDFGLIRRKARQIIRREGYAEQDFDDLVQELLARLVKGMKQFDPQRGHRKVFVTVVVERATANLIRDGRAVKRGGRHRTVSLNAFHRADESASAELGETISDREHNARRGRSPRTDEELAQLSLDLAELIGTLPTELQRLAHRLKARSIAEIARATGIPRTTLNDQVRRIRHQFEESTLRQYL